MNRNGTEGWVERPGERYMYKPTGGFPHWHEFIRIEPGTDLPVIHSRCVSGVCDRRRW